MSTTHESEAVQLEKARHRMTLANLLIGGTYGLIALVALSVLLVSAIIVHYAMSAVGTDTVRLDKGLGLMSNLVAALFPMLAAWLGAVIAYYYARENFEAATRGARELAHDIRGDSLGAITARQAMVPESRMTVARTTTEDSEFLDSVIFQRFRDKGLSRIIIQTDEGLGRGVLHDSTVLDFLANPPAGKTKADVTLGDILGEGSIKDILDKSIAFVPPDATLAEVRSRMEQASANAPRRVRDVFVTESGSNTDWVIGYISDMDIAKYGTYG